MKSIIGIAHHETVELLLGIILNFLGGYILGLYQSSVATIIGIVLFGSGVIFEIRAYLKNKLDALSITDNQLKTLDLIGKDIDVNNQILEQFLIHAQINRIRHELNSVKIEILSIRKK